MSILLGASQNCKMRLLTLTALSSLSSISLSSHVFPSVHLSVLICLPFSPSLCPYLSSLQSISLSSSVFPYVHLSVLICLPFSPSLCPHLSSLLSISLSSCLPFCPSLLPHFHDNWYLSILWKFVVKIQVSLKTDKNKKPFKWRLVYIYDKSSLNSSQNEKCSRQICRENQNTHFVLKTFSVNRAVYVTMWKKYCTAGQATDDSMAHAHCMLGTEGYKHTLRLCNIISFPLQKCLHALVIILHYM
jgi:hypothetical protein